MITIVSNIELEVGKVYSHGLSDANGNYDFNQPFLVVSKSTKEKHIRSVLDASGRVSKNLSEDDYYYDVMVD